jgi:1-acyl-sn-glycerol-3-phosphate acyltransferase
MSEAALDRAMTGGEVRLPPERSSAPAAAAATTLAPTTSAPPAPAAGTTSRPRRVVGPVAATRNLPRGDVSEFQRSFRHWFSRTVSATVIKTLYRLELTGRENIPDGPALYVFNHLSWLDPMLLLAIFPDHPRIHFYGPKEANLKDGARNKFMWWTSVIVPFSPLKDDLLTSVKWAQAVFDTGNVLAISGEGTIHVHEGDLLPFQEGAAYLALRGGVPVVPIGITGTSWARFRSTVRVRVGKPIPTGERPTRQAIANLTARTWHAVKELVKDDRDRTPPWWLERWLTDLVNDWGPGGRAAAAQQRGPDPADVPIPPPA